ncbi:alkaline phosphatase family protein [Autumnicola psychrophila]|uniref:Ectonucleotide pyrophosphatase/phosphodiesterase n=1 Tax=Autumnicola psychrophila TaxID=3075592 RepID=A0ABU3DQV5_9FLAO|nr:ectonucleotide pyrophosphatase/phosphodiesterase [Zunongwangia sp. F225]MDT0685889.1 ectonucleotide pyrophosphatase/phosphodiesterase [Zunongwangia sp. F225]
MKQLLKFTIIFLFGLNSLNAQKQVPGPAKHVVLISIDGFRPEFYKEAKWPAPNLKMMKKDGVYSDGVRGVFPSVTYPSHTTLITGAKPAKHGIFYNSPFEPEGQTGRWYWESATIKTPTLWDAVREKGGKSASFIWPVSVGAPIDYNIPEVWTLDSDYGRIAPMRNHENPEGLLAEMEENVLGKMNETNFNGDYLNREDRIGEMAAYVLENYQPDLITVHLIAADHFQHEQGREGEKVHLAISAIDRAIGKIIEAADRASILEQTAFVVTGDHGFVNIHSALKPNVWLKELGVIEDKEDRGNWTAAFHTSGASAFLHLKDASDSITLKKVEEKLNSLPLKYRKLFRVVDKSELGVIGADPHASLALAPIPGVSMSSKASGEVLISSSGGTHGYYPDFREIETGFIAWGAGVSSGKAVPKMGLEDVAPFIAHLLNLKFDAPDGVCYPGLLAEDKD